MRKSFMKGSFTREDIISRFGTDAVKQLDGMECLPTNRVIDAANNDIIEFFASMDVKDDDGYTVTITAYYYQNKDAYEAEEDSSCLNWEIDAYTVD